MGSFNDLLRGRAMSPRSNCLPYPSSVLHETIACCCTVTSNTIDCTQWTMIESEQCIPLNSHDLVVRLTILSGLVYLTTAPRFLTIFWALQCNYGGGTWSHSRPAYIACTCWSPFTAIVLRVSLSSV